MWRVELIRLLPLVFVLFTPALAAQSWGQFNFEELKEGLSDRKTPFGEAGSYQLDPVFNYTSSYGLTERHDIQQTSGNGTIATAGGFLALDSGTGTGDSATLQTVQPGIYAAGRVAEAGMGVLPEELPAANSTAFARWGAYTLSSGTPEDGVTLEITDDDSDDNLELCYSYYSGSTERARTCGIEQVDGEPQIDDADSFNGDPLPDDFDPFGEAAITVISFNWYGVGGAAVRLYYADSDDDETLAEWDMHGFAPAEGQAFNDPNLYLRQQVDAGDSGANVALEVGGRRYDVTGKDEADTRTVGAVRTGQSLSDGTLAATVCARRKSEYPSGTGRENTVSAFADTVDIVTDGQLTYFIAAVDTVSGGSWGGNTVQPSDETAIEFNTGVTGFGTIQYSSSAFPALSSQKNKQDLASRDIVKLALRASEPLCVIARGEGASPTADTFLTILERQ